MPMIHGSQISQSQLDLCAPAVLKIVTEACQAGAPSPSLRVIVNDLRSQGIQIGFAALSAVVFYLVDEGRFQREGRQHEVVYILPTGERTVPAPRIQGGKVYHTPRHLMSDEEWMERHRDPETGQLRHYGWLHKKDFHPDPRFSAQISGADGLGASSLA